MAQTQRSSPARQDVFPRSTPSASRNRPTSRIHASGSGVASHENRLLNRLQTAWKKFDSRPRNQTNGMSGLPINGRKTQPICAPTKREDDHPDLEHHLDVLSQERGPSSGSSALPGSGCARLIGHRRTRLHACGSSTLSRCSVWSRNKRPSAPETPKTTTLNKTMNG